MNKEKIAAIFDRFNSIGPNPRIELNYNTPFELLVAVLLSAQATDVSVNKVTAKLFKIAGTPTKMLALGEEKLKQHIKTIGLFNNKARHIIETSKILVAQHNSVVPDNRKDLEALSGIGRKSANIILNIVYGQPTLGVDTHIFRVANRTGLAKGKTPLAVENGLIKNIPQKYLAKAHFWLVLHGRYICKARKPLCQDCPIYEFCKYGDKL